MRPSSLALGLAGLAATALADTLPQDVADAFGAKCTDGSPPQYELFRNTSSTKWLLFMEGGGWLYGATANATKAAMAHHQGYVWPPTSDTQPAPASEHEALAAYRRPASFGDSADIGGIMAQDPAINPDFHTWNKVFMRYCDGASFGGFLRDPIAASTRDGKPVNMWSRGRGNFNGVISYLQKTLGMGEATEVILSGGSAGGLAVFYNLDHLATLLPPTTRLTGFPDAGFFLDAQASASGTYDYRGLFQGADPVWNVTGSGGTNLACLADQKAGEAWKCLMAPYLAKYIKTPYFVMNSAYDAWQLHHILGFPGTTPCLPVPGHAPCSAAENATLRAYHDQFLTAVKAVTAGKPKNGVFVDGCYVHEQNVNYCSGQGIPNCVGWSPLSSGSKKYGYTTSVAVPDGRKLTPQQAFGAYYHGDAMIAVDGFDFLDNPSCLYWGGPAPKPTPPPTPPTPPPPPTPCSDFSGHFRDSKWGPKAVDAVFTQSGCAGSFLGPSGPTKPACAFTVNGDVITTCEANFNGIKGTLSADADTIAWANGYKWVRDHGAPTPTPTPCSRRRAATSAATSATPNGDRLPSTPCSRRAAAPAPSLDPPDQPSPRATSP